MKKFFLFLFWIISCNFLYSQLGTFSTNETTYVTAGRSVYKWEIERMILQNTNNSKPVIEQKNSILKADTIIYDSKNEMGYAYNNIYFENTKDKIVLTAGEGTYNTKIKEITTTAHPVLYLKKDNTKAKSDVIKIYPEKDYIQMIGNVWVTNKKFVMEGDQAKLFQKTGKFKIYGNASAKEEKSTLYADKIDVDSKDGQLQSYTALDNVRATDSKEGYTIHSGRLDYFKDIGYSKITKNPVITFSNKNIKAYSIVMEKYDDEEKANLLGNVIIVKDNQKAYAKWGEYFIKSKKMILTGNPILVEGNSKFNANQILVDVEAETMSMIGEGHGFYEYELK
jgi:lipopolysaccharide export system protein LptA